mgnify:CR=1 FL=1
MIPVVVGKIVDRDALCRQSVPSLDVERKQRRDRRALVIHEDDERRQVLILRAQAVTDPRSDAGPAADLRAALGERLRANAWMDQETRTAALAKLDAFDPRIGNPVPGAR